MRSYEAARSLFSFLAFIAWSVVVIGVIVALISAAGASRFGGSAAGLLAMVPGIGIGITGFILVAFVQMGRATVDTAEYTQQMLKLSRDRLEISKQGLKLQNAAPQSFAAASQKEITQESKSSFASQTPKSPAPKQEVKVLKPEQPVTQTTNYQGKTIRAEQGKFLYNGIPFNTLPAAQEYIDSFAGLPEKRLPGAYRKT